MVTHDTKIMDLADRIITLEEGRIVADRSEQGVGQHPGPVYLVS